MLKGHSTFASEFTVVRPSPARLGQGSNNEHSYIPRFRPLFARHLVEEMFNRESYQ